MGVYGAHYGGNYDLKQQVVVVPPTPAEDRPRSPLGPFVQLTKYVTKIRVTGHVIKQMVPPQIEPPKPFVSHEITNYKKSQFRKFFKMLTDIDNT